MFNLIFFLFKDPDLEEETIAHTLRTHSNLTDSLPALILAEAGFLGVKIQIQNILFNSLEKYVRCVPLVSAIMSDGSGKPKKSFFFLGFGCPE